jgi:TRAP-type C4-dicarboxylate transport system substrate-binding protein
MRLSSTLVASAATLLILAATTGCQPQDRAGGTAGDDTVTLTFAQPNDDPDAQLTLWAREVDRESKGTVKIQFNNGYGNGAGYEKQTVTDVAAGKVDAGWVGARVFDRLGVTSFDALLAPMLVDSQALQGKVFAAGIPEEMLAGVDKLGVHGVGVLPGPMRLVLSKGKPLTSPGVFKGIDVGSADSAVAQQSYAALGATMTPVPTGADIDDLDAIEAQMGSIQGNHYEEKGGKSVVGNFNLWPRALVLFVGDHAWDKLSRHQRHALSQATRDVLPSALRAARDEDTSSAKSECAVGLQMPQATPAQLAVFRTAFQPVYDQIGTVSANKDWLGQIEQLKSQLGGGPDAAVCHPKSTTTTSSAALPDGTYTSKRSGKIGCVNFMPSDFRMIIDHGIERTYYKDPTTNGRFVLGAKGTFKVYKDTLQIDNGAQPVMNFTFDGRTLKLSNVRNTDCVEVAVLSGGPWRLQAADASTKK